MSVDPASAASPLAGLAEAGVSVWLDDLSRQRIVSGDLLDLIEAKHVVGATSNPTIFAAALSDASCYAEQLDALAASSATVDDALRMITTEDVRRACDLFEPVWRETSGRDGRVSLEVDPGKAYDSEATYTEATELWQTVNRPNLMIKIAATPQGLPAITRCIARGISINVTLIFSVARYRQVIEAFLAGLEQAQRSGRELSSIVSVASFFVSRVDSEVDRRLEEIATTRALSLRGTAAIANARLAYSAFGEMLGDRRWAGLSAAGAAPQRPLWASTGVKNPHYPDTLYVVELVAPGTVSTMPLATLEAFADHGVVRGDRVTGTADSARAILASLAEVGVDIDEVHQLLEGQGVRKFQDSWGKLRVSIAEQLDRRAGLR